MGTLTQTLNLTPCEKPMMAWVIMGQREMWRPIVAYREIKRGRHKGLFRVLLSSFGSERARTAWAREIQKEDQTRADEKLERALVRLLAYSNGRLGGNVYMIPQYKDALKVLGERWGIAGYLDVNASQKFKSYLED